MDIPRKLETDKDLHLTALHFLIKRSVFVIYIGHYYAQVSSKSDHH